jgi:hypothetical protein
MRALAFAALALAAAASHACRVAPQAQLIGATEQVERATDVAVGQVIAATPLGGQDVEYRFLVLEQVAGAPRKVFTVMGRAATGKEQDSAFDHHRAFAFWARGGGRTMNGSDCAIHPSFVVGNSYLVFLDSAPTWRSFEQIDMTAGRIDPDDRWLAYVKQGFAGQPASAEGVPGYERVGRFLYGFQRIMTQEDLDSKALAAQHPPPELLYRAGRLADEFDHIAKNPAKFPDAQLDATLREAGEVHAALEAWRAATAH